MWDSGTVGQSRNGSKGQWYSGIVKLRGDIQQLHIGTRLAQVWDSGTVKESNSGTVWQSKVKEWGCGTVGQSIVQQQGSVTMVQSRKSSST
jgi:hypothetical protein